MPLPAQVRILMSQHIGAPAKALVKKGDEVFVGTKIGEAGGFVSANIHSSVSGTVAAVEPSVCPMAAPVRLCRHQDRWQADRGPGRPAAGGDR